MPQSEMPAPMPVALDYDTTMIGALELSDNKWVLAVQLPGVKRHTRHVLEPLNLPLPSSVWLMQIPCSIVAPHRSDQAEVAPNAGRDDTTLADLVARGTKSLR